MSQRLSHSGCLEDLDFTVLGAPFFHCLKLLYARQFMQGVMINRPVLRLLLLRSSELTQA